MGDNFTMNDSPLLLALLASAVTALSTTFGAIPALAANRISQRMRDALMGFSAGVMLAASAFSLIMPSLRLMAEEMTSKPQSAFYVAVGILSGAVLLHALNRLIPHEHFFTGREGGAEQTQIRRIWLFVLAITLHNFPEGLAVGIGAGSQDWDLALPILVGVSLQDLPEGFVVAMALMSVRYSPLQALGVAAITGLVEAAATVLGYFAMVQMGVLLPWALALAGGAMLYVVSDEMIPESHRKENSKAATTGLMFGFVVMMFLDTALG